LSRHDITRSNQTASGADVLSIREFLPHLCSACACLTCSTWVDSLQRATSTFSLVRKFRKEGCPTRIVYRLGEHAACQAFDVQIFNRNYTEVLDKPERKLVLKLMSLVLDSLVNFLQQRNSFTATVRAFPAASNLALSTAQLRFRSLIPAWVRDRLVIGQVSEFLQPNVNPNFVSVHRQCIRFALYGETGVPLLSI
jgi:hypothetical protein